jgi:transposase
MPTIPATWSRDRDRPGLLVGALLAAGYQVYAVNPQVISRYRGRHQLSRAKSDRGDARVLADLVRTDRHNHRQAAGDSPWWKRSRC